MNQKGRKFLALLLAAFLLPVAGYAAGTKISDMTEGGTIQAADDLPVVRAGANLKVSVGSAATYDTGTSGTTVPLLDGANTWSAANGFPQVNVDNLRLDGNTLSSTDTNGNIVLTPNGTGVTRIGSGSNYWEIDSNGRATHVGTASLDIATNAFAFRFAAAPTGGMSFTNTGGSRVNILDTAGVEKYGFYLGGANNALNSAWGFSCPETAPAQITADQNNYAALNLFCRGILDTDAARVITGFAAATGSRGKEMTIVYIGSTTLTIADEATSTASTAANRCLNIGAGAAGTDIVLNPFEGARLVYSSSLSRWLMWKL